MFHGAKEERMRENRNRGLMKIYDARNPADAHLLKGLLEGENIQAVVRGEYLWGTRGETPLTPETSPSVWVPEDDFERAMELVSAFRSEEDVPEPPQGEEWRCAACGETNEWRFTECWRCGRTRG
jgi:hypothetical protein